MKHRISFVSGFAGLLALSLAFAPRPALAAFHVMEIEQVVGGVGGDTTAQAITLKMRAAGQNFVVGAAQVVVRDAAGLNPLTIATFAGTNPTSGACREILLTTPGMTAKTQPAVVNNFTMTAIPASYLAAGSLTFESLGGGVTWWRISWGGAAYTGAQTVSAGTNDADGLTAPPFAGSIPTSGAQALKFTPACAALSTNSAADYNVISSPVLVNNALASFNVVNLLPIPGLPGASKYLLPGLLALGIATFALLRRRRVSE